MHPVDILNLYRNKELASQGMYGTDSLTFLADRISILEGGPVMCISCRKKFGGINALHNHITKSH